MLTDIINNCWKTLKYSIAALAATFAINISSAKAHEILVHEWITEQAVEYICQKPDYKEICDEVKPMLAILKEGVADEDALFPSMNKSTGYNGSCNVPGDTRTRFFYHFLRPIDGKGYFNWTPIASHQFENVIIWGLDNKNNLCDFQDSITLYQLDKKRSYFALAHVLHLVQDVTLPEHTNLEAHAFVAPYGIITINQFGFEHYCDIILKKDKRLPLPNKDEQFHIRSIKDYFELGSFIGYTINRFSANLKDTEIKKKGAELGVLGKMFPSLHYQGQLVDIFNSGWRIDGNYWKHDLNPYFEGMWRGSYVLLDDWWQIKSFPHPPNNKEKDGWFYIEAPMQAFPEIFKIGWVKKFTPLHTMDEIEQLFQSAIETDNPSHYTTVAKFPTRKSLAELLADELVPLAIQNTAGAIIWYWQQVHKSFEGDYSDHSVKVSVIKRNFVVQNVTKEDQLFPLQIVSKDGIHADVHHSPGKEKIIFLRTTDPIIPGILKIYSSTNKELYSGEFVSFCTFSIADLLPGEPMEIFSDCPPGGPEGSNYISIATIDSSKLISKFSQEYSIRDKKESLLRFKRDNSSKYYRIEFTYREIIDNPDAKIGIERFKNTPELTRTFLYDEKEGRYKEPKNTVNHIDDTIKSEDIIAKVEEVKIQSLPRFEDEESVVDVTNTEIFDVKVMVVYSIINGKKEKLILTPATPLFADICDNPGDESIREQRIVTGGIHDANTYFELQIRDSKGIIISRVNDRVNNTNEANWSAYSLANIITNDKQKEIFVYSYFNDYAQEEGGDSHSITIYKCFGTNIKPIYNEVFSSARTHDLKSKPLQQIVNITFPSDNQMKVFFRYYGYHYGYQGDSMEDYVPLKQFKGLFEYNPQQRIFIEKR
ncbi:hypothetical protein J4232_01195 [Candidatus Woesearchaeota archaeon]|nr:hypothetical protein [Candidatus Woesearchaeota archaeon]